MIHDNYIAMTYDIFIVMLLEQYADIYAIVTAKLH